MQSAMIRMGKLPRWRFRHGANEVLFTSEKTGVPEWLRLIVSPSLPPPKKRTDRA